MPSDAVTAYYEVAPADHALSRIIEEFGDSIALTTKSPVRAMGSRPNAGKVIAEDKYDLKVRLIDYYKAWNESIVFD